MFLSRIFKSAEPKPVTTEAIVEACNKTSKFLNDLLGTHDVKIKIATDCKDFQTYTDYGEQWSKSQFDWNTPLSQIPFSENPSTYVLGLYKGYTLCGLCDTGINGNKALEIESIEKAPAPVSNPLSGLTIAAFSAVNLELAKDLGIPSIAVERPHPKTIKTYRNLGYRFNFLSSSPRSMRVKPNTELNWKKAMSKRNDQGTDPPPIPDPLLATP